MKKDKQNRLVVERNQYGHRVSTSRTIYGNNAPAGDTGHRSIFIKNICEGNAEHLLKRFLLQFKGEGCTLDEMTPTRSKGGLCVELSSDTRDVVILYRPVDSKLSIHTYYLKAGL